MRCQICDTPTDNVKYNDSTGKMDVVCNDCTVVIRDVTSQYHIEDELIEDE